MVDDIAQCLDVVVPIYFKRNGLTLSLLNTFRKKKLKDVGREVDATLVRAALCQFVMAILPLWVLNGKSVVN